MEFRKFDNNYVIRIDKGEEIITSLTKLCKEEDIRVGTIIGIGAVDRLTVGLFNPTTKVYQKEEFKDNYEIVNLTGNISRMDDEVYIHAHISVTDATYKAIGGHLNEAYVSATCEITITKIDGTVNRRFDEEIVLNLYEF